MRPWGLSAHDGGPVIALKLLDQVASVPDGKHRLLMRAAVIGTGNSIVMAVAMPALKTASVIAVSRSQVLAIAASLGFALEIAQRDVRKSDQSKDPFLLRIAGCLFILFKDMHSEALKRRNLKR